MEVTISMVILQLHLHFLPNLPFLQKVHPDARRGIHSHQHAGSLQSYRLMRLAIHLQPVRSLYFSPAHCFPPLDQG
ncbi:hypothetical protein D3C73_1446090 [compost metagenome]